MVLLTNTPGNYCAVASSASTRDQLLDVLHGEDCSNRTFTECDKHNHSSNYYLEEEVL